MNYNQQPPPYFNTTSVDVQTQTNSVLKRVYLRMFIGLLISAFCALGVASSTTAISFIFGNPIVFIGMFIAMIIMAIAIPSRMHRMATGTVMALFCAFCALMGCTLSSVFLVYKLGSIVYTFFISAGMFGVMSVYGYFTKSNLDKIGSLCAMALIGIIIASIVNIFVASSAMGWIISFVGVLIFVGLTAWDTQQIKRMAEANLSPALADKLATLGALNLYLDFVNLFLYLLRFLGDRR